MEFNENIVTLFKEKFPEKNIYDMSLEELKQFKIEVEDIRNEYYLLELAHKTLGNAAYGASANHAFYFYNVKLAGDITGECRVLTKTMWHNLEHFFHETLWERKDLWEKFNFELDESKHDWYRQQTVSIYSDTDSCFSKALLLLKDNKNIEEKITIEDLFNQSYENFGLEDITKNNQEIVKCDKNILNWNKENGLQYVPIKYVMRHKVSKSKFKIITKSGKEIIVTGDHSCIVFRDGKQIVIKAKDINKSIDKILSIHSKMYQIEDIELIEQLDNFDNEYVYDIEVDDNSHTFIANDILVHNSVYTTYGTLFQAMTKESQERYKTDEDKTNFILKFNKEFLDKQNTQWCEEMYGPRHGKSIHNFELETISRAGIYLKKKKYLKGLIFNKGKFLKEPKISGTGIEIIKSTTPKLCREMLKNLMKSLMFEFDDSTEESRTTYIMQFNEKLSQYRKQFYSAPIEDISQSVGIGNYKKYVIDDKEFLILGKQCPVSVHAIARFNYLAHKNEQDDKCVYSGKIKYYNIAIGNKTGYFGFPAGQLPLWAPRMDKLTQWQKNIIDPINRFLEVMKIPLVSASNVIQLELF